MSVHLQHSISRFAILWGERISHFNHVDFKLPSVEIISGSGALCKSASKGTHGKAQRQSLCSHTASAELCLAFRPLQAPAVSPVPLQPAFPTAGFVSTEKLLPPIPLTLGCLCIFVL